ncbi:MAG TPA: enoyl-CoA hydratase/isomerase family protein [Nitrososphaerales archaeon]|nr:enoyl-CoA hydratase/isomerase family protein [Nitrososphaerales archaeon]
MSEEAKTTEGGSGATQQTTFQYILYEVRPRSNYAKITINRPEVMNALNLQVRQEILAALDLAEKDEEARCVVLTGSGEKAFSAGADLKMFLTMTPFQAKEYLKVSKGASNRLENFPKPVIAAVNGYAMGGGLELAMSCDIIIASENAKFAQSEINVGLIPGVGGTQRLPRIVGLKRAKELVFTGTLIDSQEALRIGLVNKVVPQNDLAKEVESLVQKISEKSPLILRLAKEALNRSAASLKDGLDYESSLFAFCFSTRDQKEGAQAFLDKRKPAFKGD